MPMVLAAQKAIVYRADARPSSPPLADAAAFERDDLTACAIVEHLLRYFLGDAQEPFASIHLAPDVYGANAGRYPQHHQVVDQIGAFLDDCIAVAVHRVDHDLDCL